MSPVWKRRSVAFVIAVVCAAVWGSVVQTQFNLADLIGLGAPIDGALRASVTGRDLLGFAPLYLMIVIPALLIAFAVAGLLARRNLRWRTAWFALGGFVALGAAIRLVDALVAPPVLIAATRETPGLLAMMAGGAIAGVIFALITRQHSRPSH